MGRSGYYKPNTYRVENSVGYLLKTASNLAQAHLEQVFQSHALTPIQWKVLMYLRDGVATTCADISRDLPHDSGSLTRIVDDLENKSFLERDRSRKDRRVVTLRLTPRGLRAVNAAVPAVVDLMNAALRHLSREEVNQLIVILRGLIAGLRDVRSDNDDQPKDVR